MGEPTPSSDDGKSSPHPATPVSKMLGIAGILGGVVVAGHVFDIWNNLRGITTVVAALCTLGLVATLVLVRLITGHVSNEWRLGAIGFLMAVWLPPLLPTGGPTPTPSPSTPSPSPSLISDSISPSPARTPAPDMEQVACEQMGWGRSSGGPIPGCECGTETVGLRPEALSGRVGQVVRFNWEANPLCRGQSGVDPNHTVDWGDGTLEAVSGNVCLEHAYGAPGNYTIRITVRITCYDYGASGCKKPCEARGVLTARILPR
jgi:hypothetical protein